MAYRRLNNLYNIRVTLTLKTMDVMKSLQKKQFYVLKILSSALKLSSKVPKFSTMTKQTNLTSEKIFYKFNILKTSLFNKTIILRSDTNYVPLFEICSFPEINTVSFEAVITLKKRYHL